MMTVHTSPGQTAAPRPIQTVLGPMRFDSLGVTDAHNHVWIAPVAGSDPSSPVLDQKEAILAELVDYKASGGSAILDCQPGGCGRDGKQLANLSRASQVQIIACTGFHRRKYYPAAYWLWEAAPETAARH